MRSCVRALLPCLAVALAPAPSGAVSGPWFETPEASVRLISRHAAARAGGDAGLAVEFRLAPGWHVYWKNAGDSGLPTNFSWTLPAGLSAGDIDWPTPRQLPIGPLLNFGYDDSVLLPVPVTVTAPAAGGAL